MIPEHVLEAPLRPKEGDLTIGQSIIDARRQGLCIGYQKYSRTPGRIAWFRCGRSPELDSERCLDCTERSEDARADERADERARAANRKRLNSAVAPLRVVWSETLDGFDVRSLVRDIEDAVRGMDAGGQGNYWLALRVLLGMD